MALTCLIEAHRFKRLREIKKHPVFGYTLGSSVKEDNYNWDNGFDIPQTVLDNKKCDLSIALFIFYRADGLSYLEDKTDNANLPQWYSFIKRLYDSILTGEYQSGEIEFKVPLSKVQLFKLKKVIAEEENIFTENIEGKCLDINL